MRQHHRLPWLDRNMLDSLPPPPAYSMPYAGPLIELVLPYNHVNIVCRLIGVDVPSSVPMNGCAYVIPNGCLVIVPRVEGDITADDQSKVLKHELAHCNGWKHPGPGAA